MALLISMNNRKESLIKKLGLRDAYDPDGYGFDEPFIRYRAVDGREKEALEDYLDTKKKVFLLEHHINNMNDVQMKEIAIALFLHRKQQKNAEVLVCGHPISARTICREKKRQFLIWHGVLKDMHRGRQEPFLLKKL